jgi:hypothetical protein
MLAICTKICRPIEFYLNTSRASVAECLLKWTIPVTKVVLKTGTCVCLVLSTVPCLTETVTVPLYTMLLLFRRRIVCVGSAILITAAYNSIDGMTLTGENRSTRGTSCPNTSLSTTNIMCGTGLGSNPRLRRKSQATNSLSHGTVIYRLRLTWIIFKDPVRTAQ